MKKNLLYLFALICSMNLFIACSDDDTDNGWRDIPGDEIIAGNNATFEINGQALTAGSIQLTAKNESEAELIMKNVLPGYAKVTVDVELAKQSDGSFNFTGKKGLATPPAMFEVKDVASQPAIFDVTVQGNINADGKVFVKVTSALSTEAKGGLSGSWNTLAKFEYNEYPTLVKSPLMIKCSPIDPKKPNIQLVGDMGTIFGSVVLFNYLNQVTFHEDGNITAKYWSGEMPSLEEILNGLDENYNIILRHEDWLSSPKSNLAFWYVKGEYIYVVPNLTAILGQVAGDNGGQTPDLGGLGEIVGKLGEYGIDIIAFLPLAQNMMSTGIPLKYTKTDKELKIYVDKAMVDPFMKLLLPALDKLQEDVDKIMADPESETAVMINMLYFMLGIENLGDIKTAWNENTKEFEIAIILTK